MPAKPIAVPAAPFPIVGCVAPIVVSVVIWAITQSPFALVFAALGPIIAVASIVDSRWHGTKRFTTDAADYRLALDSLRADAEDAREQEREQLKAHTPSARALIDSVDDEERWRTRFRSPEYVAIGHGRVASGIRIVGDVLNSEYRELRDLAQTLDDASVIVDANMGIGVCGPRPLARALVRGYVLQLMNSYSPKQAELRVPHTDQWSWAWQLPHCTGPQVLPAPAFSSVQENVPAVVVIVTELGEPSPTATSDLIMDVAELGPVTEPQRVIRLGIAESASRLPVECSAVIRVAGVSTATTALMDGVGSGTGAGQEVLVPRITQLRTEPVSAADAALFAHRLSDAAQMLGFVPILRVPRPPVALGDLLIDAQLSEGGDLRTTRDCLQTAIGTLMDGPSGAITATSGAAARAGLVQIDLVSDGPHAIVGGTTGSGKSELLTTWITSMAARYGPQQVTFLLVDFKGGASFAPLMALPHCVGLITDLDEAEAARAMESLRAEIRYREAVLRDAGARDIADAGFTQSLPRLVIAVDEFATMLDSFPDLYSVFVDVAARGRSLGMHVILCTQRPAGVVRDSLLANCNLRLSLRVNNRADSSAVIGTDSAAALPTAPPGACLVSTAAHGVRALQIATTTPAVIQAVIDRYARRIPDSQHVEHAQSGPRRPWLDPLPHVLPLTALLESTRSAEDQFVLGLADVPSEQKQIMAAYRPLLDGNLLVLGAHRTGKTTLMNTIAYQQPGRFVVQAVPSDMEGAWDLLTTMVDTVRRGASPADISEGNSIHHVLLFDDVDSVTAQMSPEYQQDFIDMIAMLLRDGPGSAIHLVMTAQRLVSGLQGLVSLFTSVLLLRMSNRQDHLLAGGEPSHWTPDAPPGAGLWRGCRVQIAVSATPASVTSAAGPAGTLDETPDLVFEPGQGYLVVTSAPLRRIRSLRSLLGENALIMDVAQHQMGNTAGGLGVRLASRGAAGGTDANADALTMAPTTAPTVLVGDVDSWQSQWTLLGALKVRMTLVFDGCALADYRAVIRSRSLPPPLHPGRSRIWVLSPDGEVYRARWRDVAGSIAD